MNFYAWAGLINAVTCLVAGLFVWSRHQRDPRRITFVLFMLSVGTWAIFYVFWQLAEDEPTALFFARALCAGAFFAPITHMHHVATLVNATDLAWTRRLIRFGYTSAVILLFANMTPLVVREVSPRMFFPYWPLPGPLWYFYTAIYFGYWVYTVHLIRHGISTSTGSTRNGFQYVLAGTLIAFAGASMNFLPWYDILIPPIGTIAVPFYVILVALAALRYQFMDFHIVIRKSLVYSLLVTVLTVGYFGLVYGVERLFQMTFGYRSVWVSLSAFALMALLFQPLKVGIQRAVDWLFFHAPHEEVVRRMERLEREVRDAEKLKAVSTLAAGMAHEIKNPLTAIKTFTEYLPEKGTDPAFQQKFQRIVTHEVDKIDRIVRELLNFAKPAQPQLQPVQLSTLLDETLDFLSSEVLKRRVDVMRAYTPDDTIHADPQQLRQVFLNLFLNSFEAMTPPPARLPGRPAPDGAAVPLAEAAAGGMNGGGRLVVSTARNADHLTVTIRDSGLGIPKEQLSHIFDPFFTTKQGGTGLGLSVVHGIVKEHRGDIRIDSQPGEGTTVKIEFPLG